MSQSMTRERFAQIIKPALLVLRPGWWENEHAELYYEHLRTVPEDALAKGVARCVDDMKFFPKPAELKAAALPDGGSRRAENGDRDRAAQYIERCFEARIEGRTYKADDGYLPSFPFHKIIDDAVNDYDAAVDAGCSKSTARSRGYGRINVATRSAA